MSDEQRPVFKGTNSCTMYMKRKGGNHNKMTVMGSTFPSIAADQYIKTYVVTHSANDSQTLLQCSSALGVY